LIPNFDSLHTLLGTILAFLLSVALLFTRSLESAETEERQRLARVMAKSFPSCNLKDANGNEERVREEDDIASSQESRHSEEKSRKSSLKRLSQTI